MKKQELNGNILVNIVVSISCNLVKPKRFTNQRILILRSVFTAFCLINMTFMYSQDPSFAQPYANKMVLNPAFAGDTECAVITTGYRNHLPESGAYNTYVLSFQTASDLLNGGFGFIFMNDRQGKGIFNRYSLSASYAYHFNLTRNISVNAGLEAGIVHRNRKTAGLLFPDMLDPYSGGQTSQDIIPDGSRNFPDISSGIIASYKNYYFGFALHHIAQPDESVSTNIEHPLRRKFTFHAGTSIPVGTGRNIDGLITKGQWTFSPTFIFQHQGESSTMSYGMYISRQEINIGAWLKQDLLFNDYSLAFLAGFSGESLSFAYSFDFGMNISAISMPYSGSHEISVGIKFPCVEKRKKIRAVKCPNF